MTVGDGFYSKQEFYVAIKDKELSMLTEVAELTNNAIKGGNRTAPCGTPEEKMK